MSLELFLTIVGAAALVVTGFWAISKVAMAQFEKRLEERFKGFEKAVEEIKTVGGAQLADLQRKYEALDKDVRQILIELPREYVARADYVRHETLIEAKIDQLRLSLENWKLTGGKPQ